MKRVYYEIVYYEKYNFLSKQLNMNEIILELFWKGIVSSVPSKVWKKP